MRKNMPLTLLTLASTIASGWAACGYFGPDGPRGGGGVAIRVPVVTQPSQRAFITWDQERGLESFTVQPEFKGDAKDFGMVIPTPARPKLQDMPRDFFSALSRFTVLAPLDTSKFRMPVQSARVAPSVQAESTAEARRTPPQVKILERGMVGSLDYKILEADGSSQALFSWLREHKYSYRGNEAIIQEYVKKRWLFTVMKIDSRNMKKRAEGGFLGEVTPTRFTFAVKKPIYPLRITQVSVIDGTDVQLFVLARKKMDLRGSWSYEPNFWSMWQQSMRLAYPEKLTAQEKSWIPFVDKARPIPVASGSNLEWAGKMTSERLAGLPHNKSLTVLKGHLKPGWTLTRLRKRFQRSEMTQDIEFVSAAYQGREDDMEYVSTLPFTPAAFDTMVSPVHFQ